MSDPSIPPPTYNQEPAYSPYTGFTASAQYSPYALNPGQQEAPLPNVMPLEGDSYIKKYWRPIMAWQYLIVCMFDFIGGPVTSMYFFSDNQQAFQAWTSLTLQGGGLYHIAMGAIIGVTAWSRGQEKMRGIEK